MEMDRGASVPTKPERVIATSSVSKDQITPDGEGHFMMKQLAFWASSAGSWSDRRIVRR